MSIGDDPGPLPITFDHLKIIELFEVSFEDMKEVLVLLRLITSSPNLEEFSISVSDRVPLLVSLCTECSSILSYLLFILFRLVRAHHLQKHLIL